MPTWAPFAYIPSAFADFAVKTIPGRIMVPANVYDYSCYNPLSIPEHKFIDPSQRNRVVKMSNLS